MIRIGHVAGNLLAFVLLPAAILGVREVMVRVGAPDDLALHTGEEEMIDRRSPYTIHVNRPGFEGNLWSRRVTIDEHGLRFSGRSSGSFRVLLTGDSVLFGAGVDDADSPGAVLAALAPDSIHVSNGAVIGYATEHVLAYLNEFGDRLRPQVVVLGYCLNDALPFDSSAVVNEEELRQRYGFLEWVNAQLRRHSLLYLWLKDSVDAYRVRHGYDVHRALFEGDGWTRNRSALSAIAAWCEERETLFLLAIFPHRDQLMNVQDADFAPQDSLAAFAERTNINFIDLRDELEPEDYLRNDPVHLDRRGIQKAMSAIWNRLEELLTRS